MKKIVAAVGTVVAALALSAGPALGYAQHGKGKSASAPGRANAVANCVETILKQNANGQTGSETGSANDKKQLPTGVTNCDHFWDEDGVTSASP